MADLAVFCDIEAAVIALIADIIPAATIAPPDLGSMGPFARVSRFGGSDNLITDTARVDVDCFAATRAEAYAAAEQVRQRLLCAPHVIDTVGTIDRAATLTSPNEVPWADPNLRRFTASYSLTSRR